MAVLPLALLGGATRCPPQLRVHNRGGGAYPSVAGALGRVPRPAGPMTGRTKPAQGAPSVDGLSPGWCGCQRGPAVVFRRLSASQAAENVAAEDGVGGGEGEEDVQDVVVGIDLGTTNSAVALLEGGKPRVVPVEGEQVLPSVVAFTKDGRCLVGAPAKRQAVLNPESTFYSVKRFIGKRWAEVKEDAKQVAFAVRSDDHGTAVLPCTHSPEGVFYPEEVSSLVVGELLEAAQDHAGAPVRRAVISVPAYFSDEQKEATIMAGKLAGLETVRLVREPVAAALAYGLDLQEDATVLVFDLGGGTFDISILEVGNGVVEVLSTGGDAHLGGDDWDQSIVDWLSRTYLRPAGIDPRDPRVLANLKTMAELAKIKLSTSDKVSLTLPIGGKDGKGVRTELTRQDLGNLAAPLFKRAALPLEQACWQAGTPLDTARAQIHRAEAQNKRRGKSKRRSVSVDLTPKTRDPISKVLLVGGSTKMPAVKQFITNMSGMEPDHGDFDPDEAVALGAAVQAGVLAGEIQDLMVMDIWQANLMRAFAQQTLEADADAADRFLGPQGAEGAEEFGDDDYVDRYLEEHGGAADGGAADGGESGDEGFVDLKGLASLK